MAASIRCFCLILCGLLVAHSEMTPGAEWSRFRGPNGSAVSESKNLPEKWGDSENLA